MGLHATRAVVSDTMRISNSSKLVSLITEHRGLVKVMARGARRPTSRYGAALEPLTLVDVIYYSKAEREIQSLSSADIIEAYPRIKTDLKTLAAGSAMMEAAQTLTPTDDPSSGTFTVLVEALDGLECHETDRPDVRFWRFMLRLLAVAGYRPSLDRCVLCGRKPHSANAFFSHADGGVVCSCASVEGKYGFRVSPGSLMAMKSLMTSREDELGRIRIGRSQRREIEQAVLQFYSYHTGSSRPPRALAFMRKVDAFFMEGKRNEPETGMTVDDAVMNNEETDI